MEPYHGNSQESYIKPWEVKQIGDKKPSLRAELIDREKNFSFKDVPVNEPEKPNSQVNNPAAVSNVILDTGDLWKVETTSENPQDQNHPKFHGRTVTYDYKTNPGGATKKPKPMKPAANTTPTTQNVELNALRADSIASGGPPGGLSGGQGEAPVKRPDPLLDSASLHFKCWKNGMMGKNSFNRGRKRMNL